MSALGQEQIFRSAVAMSALPPKADIRQRHLVEATGRSLLHLEPVDGQLGIVRVRTRFDGWRRNVPRGCTSTGVGGGISLRGRYSFGRSLRG